MVQADPELRDLILSFLASKRAAIREVLHDLDKGYFQSALVLGHRLKGEGSSYGFETITAVGEALEQAASREERDLALNHAHILASYLFNVEVVYGQSVPPEAPRATSVRR
jgi:HPt (histidine-containing phosphotransfer) domain-containing protein